MGAPLLIDRLYQGASGQAPWQRKQGTVESSQNVRFDIRVGGAVKRNATELIAELDEYTGETFDATKSYFWISIRDAIIAISTDGDVHGWNGTTGAPLNTIDDTSGGFATYMTLATDPEDDIDVTVSFDSAVVCNRKHIPTLVPGWSYQESLNMIQNADINDGTTVAGIATVNIQSVVNEFSSLPDSAVLGEVHSVESSELLNPLGLYIRWDSDDTNYSFHPNSSLKIHAQDWVRIPQADEVDAAYEPTDMPYVLLYDAVLQTLTIKIAPWRPRLSGNETTNAPMPWASIGQNLESVEFHSGRLILLARALVTSSRKGDFFNLWNFDVGAISNSDRIIANITQSENGNALRARSGGGGLFIVMDNGQVEFSSGSAELTNINGRTVTIMDLPSKDFKPAASGNAVTMIDELGDVHQFAWQVGDRDSSLIYSGLLSAHKWDILDGKTPVRVFSIGTTIFITTTEGDTVVHDSFFVGGQAEQSAWGDFTPQDDPVFFSKWRDKIRVITRTDTSAGGYTLLHYVHREQEPPDAFLSYMPALDRMEKADSSNMTYDEITDRTEVVHTGRDGTLDDSRIVLTEPDAHAVLRPLLINASGNPEFDGDLTGQTQNYEHWIGFKFKCEIVLTDLYPGITGQNLVMQRLVVFHLNSSDYEVVYTDAGGEVRTSQWQAHRVGVAILGEPSLDTGFSDHGVRGDPRTQTITLRSDTPGQVAWLALEYELQGQGRGSS